MKKMLDIIRIGILILIIAMFLIFLGCIYSKRDEIVTSNVSMEYFVKTIEVNDKNRSESFVAKSNNDVLYANFISTMDNIYYYEGVSDLNFEITKKELFGNGKYQCYLSNSFENYVPKCDLENEGRYVNYLIEARVTYLFNGEKVTRDEKGLVVFVKDMVDGNYFTWKLVRFDRYKVE